MHNKSHIQLLDKVNFQTLFQETQYESTVYLSEVKDDKGVADRLFRRAIFKCIKENPLEICNQALFRIFSYLGTKNFVLSPTQLGTLDPTCRSLEEALAHVFDFYNCYCHHTGIVGDASVANFLIPLAIDGHHWVTLHLQVRFYKGRRGAYEGLCLKRANLYDSTSGFFKKKYYNRVRKIIEHILPLYSSCFPDPVPVSPELVSFETICCCHQTDNLSSSYWTNVYIRQIIAGKPPAIKERSHFVGDERLKLSLSPENFCQRHKAFITGISVGILIGIGTAILIFLTGGAFSPLTFWLGWHFLQSLSVFEISALMGLVSGIVVGALVTLLCHFGKAVTDCLKFDREVSGFVHGLERASPRQNGIYNRSILRPPEEKEQVKEEMKEEGESFYPGMAYYPSYYTMPKPVLNARQSFNKWGKRLIYLIFAICLFPISLLGLIIIFLILSLVFDARLFNVDFTQFNSRFDKRGEMPPDVGVKDFTLTCDNFKLPGVEIQDKSSRLVSNRYVIKFPGNGGNKNCESFKRLASWSKTLANAVTFEYQQYRDFYPTESRCVNNGIIEVQRLLNEGVLPENIILYGLSFGGAVATLVARYFHEQGKQVYLFDDRSFSSITNFAVGLIRGDKEKSDKLLEKFFILLRKFLGFILWPIIKIFLVLLDFDFDAGSAFKKIPDKYKRCINVNGDGVISSYASMLNALSKPEQEHCGSVLMDSSFYNGEDKHNDKLESLKRFSTQESKTITGFDLFDFFSMKADCSKREIPAMSSP